MQPFNFGHLPIIEQFFRPKFASKAIEATASTALQPADINTAVQGIDYGLNQGRLSLSNTDAVPTGNLSGSTIYFLPMGVGNGICLKTGGVWRLYRFGTLSLNVSAIASGTSFDIFLYDNEGTLTLEALNWTNPTTRATALALEDGVYVRSGQPHKRYIGTAYTDTLGTVKDGIKDRGLWNFQNQRSRPLFLKSPAGTWSAINGTRPFNGANLTSRFTVVTGLNQTVNVTSIGNAGGNGDVRVGVALDSITSEISNYIGGNQTPSAADDRELVASMVSIIITPGYHYIQGVEVVSSANPIYLDTQCGLISNWSC